MYLVFFNILKLKITLQPIFWPKNPDLKKIIDLDLKVIALGNALSSEWQIDPGDELNQETSFFLTSGVVDKWWQSVAVWVAVCCKSLLRCGSG